MYLSPPMAKAAVRSNVVVLLLLIYCLLLLPLFMFMCLVLPDHTHLLFVADFSTAPNDLFQKQMRIILHME